jgi:asparagine synthase (glutamine-hydrolysing)
VVAGLAAHQAERPVAFTVGFSDEQDHSEAEAAAETARRLDIPHQVLWLSRNDALGAIEPWLTSLDQPSLDGLNTYLVSQAVRQAGAVVALSGQGGDELFGGYSAFSVVPRLAKVLRWLRSLPPDARSALTGPLGIGRPSSFREKLRDVLHIGPDLVGLALQQRRLLSDRQIRQLVPGMAADLASRHFLEGEALADLPIAFDDPVHAVSLLECRYYLGGTLLRVGDATGMAHSLEIRVPILDRAVLDLAFRIPGDQKLPSGRADKALLRAAFPEYLRPELLAQKKKGFVIPVKRWMLGPLRPICEAALDAVKAQPEFNPAAVDAVWNGFRKEPESSGWSRAWALVALGSFLLHGRGTVAVGAAAPGERAAL